MDAKEARGEYLVELISRYAGRDSKILEVGCRAGDNLVSLWRAGFTNLAGLEDNAEKVDLFLEHDPDVAKAVGVTAGPMRELTRGIADDSFDLVFTVGYLFDKRGDYSWLFPELARLAGRYLISIEDEGGGRLEEVFEDLGLREVEAIDVSRKRELESVFFARVFEKPRVP